MLHVNFHFLATAFYDNAFGFSALKVNKFIELKILQPIRSEHAGEERREHAGKDSTLYEMG